MEVEPKRLPHRVVIDGEVEYCDGCVGCPGCYRTEEKLRRKLREMKTVRRALRHLCAQYDLHTDVLYALHGTHHPIFQE